MDFDDMPLHGLILDQTIIIRALIISTHNIFSLAVRGTIFIVAINYGVTKYRRHNSCVRNTLQRKTEEGGISR